MNSVYDNVFYNEEQKTRYLKGLTERTYIVYSRILKRASYIEEQLNKDLYDFNIAEIEQFMNFLAPTTMTSSNDALSIIRAYIRWAIQEDLRKDNVNPLETVMSDSFIRKFVDTSVKMFFTKREIERLTGGLVNFQDSALVQCLFEGIMGNGYSEILNILKKDIDRDSNNLMVRNAAASGELQSRVIPVSSRLMNMLFSAANETIYHKNNGNPDVNLKAKDGELIDNEFVFRAVKMNTKEYGRANSHLVSRRITNIGEWFDYPHLTPMNIKKSGMLWMAKQLVNQSGKLEREEVVEVCRQFRVDSKITTRLTRDFLNLNTINKLYTEE
ncbi:phage lytic cycle repressor MrpR family protein [Paenibacillus tuaregi]|uniref:phage lytic cycle repressor MrpR family protein n=1 Tax=Paenibacillus tuaregi TaxID=1816681 RepID=UPI0008388D9F|nr:hypothetical protein [Paenibacillus tuaregi]